MQLAQLFKAWVIASSEFDLVVDTPLNLICFRHRDGDATSELVLETANASGKIYLTHTKLDDQMVLRLSVGQTYTEERHVRLAWDVLTEAARSAPGAVGPG